jgi:SPP1 gp7 family putative phage head morphogenesis protein
VFNADAEHKELQPIVRRNVAALMANGAKSELAALERHRRARKAIDPLDPEYGERFGLDAHDLVEQFIESIPPAIRQAIRHAVDETTRQPYWRAIQDNVAGDIGDIIKTSIDAGDSPTAMAARIRYELGGEGARQRAAMIARTETTGTLNAGHAAAIESIEASDLVVGREWLAIGDDDTRETHLAVHGHVAAKAQKFIVGGFEARYPGDCNLPAQERVRCRCTVVAAFAE